MVPSPPLWAVLGDVLLCLGAGLLLGAVRDGATLAFGSGSVRCFVWDVLAFAAAAFVCCGFAAGASATGAARWYAQDSCEKSGKKPKNVLQNKHTILYN